MRNDMDATQETPSSEKDAAAMIVDEPEEKQQEAETESTSGTNSGESQPFSPSTTSSSPTPSSVSSSSAVITSLAEKPLAPDCSSTSSESTDSDANVEQVIAKSKRAASFLWMLLQAQRCTEPIDSTIHRHNHGNDYCCFKGCRKVKRLLLHIKSCPARNNPSAPCPCNYQGCQDARKLLAHYKLCKENAKVQRKQSMNNKLKGKQQQENNFSLILTLLARHDQEMTEKMKRDRIEQQRRREQEASSTEAAAIALTSMFTSNIPKSSTSLSSKFGSSNHIGHTKTVQFNLNNENESHDSHMPPPAPRTRSRTSSVGSISSLLRAAKVKNRRSRPRAGSLDEWKSFSSFSSSNHNNTYEPIDPTLELELIKPTTTFDIPSTNHEHKDDGDDSEEGLTFRKRSVSCSSVFTNSIGRRYCDTIMEE